jgi:hypothetical protein
MEGICSTRKATTSLEKDKKKFLRAQEKTAKAQRQSKKQEEKETKDWLIEHWKEMAT